MNVVISRVQSWVATTLVGTGIGTVGAFAGLRLVGVVLGSVLLLAGGVVVGATITVWNVAVVRDASTPATLVTPGLFRAATAGFFGAGLLVGALLEPNWPMAVAGLAGLVALVVLRHDSAA